MALAQHQRYKSIIIRLGANSGINAYIVAGTGYNGNVVLNGLSVNGEPVDATLLTLATGATPVVADEDAPENLARAEVLAQVQAEFVAEADQEMGEITQESLPTGRQNVLTHLVDTASEVDE